MVCVRLPIIRDGTSAGDRLAPGRKSGSTCLSHGCAVLAGRAAVHTPEHPYARHPDETENRTPYGRLCRRLVACAGNLYCTIGAFHPAHRLRNLRFRDYPVQCRADCRIGPPTGYVRAAKLVHRRTVRAQPVLLAVYAWTDVLCSWSFATPSIDGRAFPPLQLYGVQGACRPFAWFYSSVHRRALLENGSGGGTRTRNFGLMRPAELPIAPPLRNMKIFIIMKIRRRTWS